MEEDNQALDELEQIIMEGDEQKAKDYLIENFNNFSEDVQTDISMAFFQEGLDKAIETKLEEGSQKSLGALEICQEIKNTAKSLDKADE